ncbi:hypothetical protein BH23ACT3_BH23ACT3_01590 [soil metagenome]
MTSKGTSPVTHDDVGDLAPDDAAVAVSGRRALIGAGVIGAVLAITGGQRVSATAWPAVGAPTGDEAELLEFVMRLELTIRDLYDAAIDSGGLVDVAGAMREQHEAYAQGLAAFTGLSARDRNDEVYDSLESDFTGGDDAQVALAAYDVESIAVATHTEIIRLVERADIARLLASIVAVEARHCAVLADAAGLGDDLDALLDNDAEPLLPEDLS